MPTLDVNDAFDPSFMDTITVIRRTISIGMNGRRMQSETAFSVQAVVTASGPDDLQRLPEVEHMNKAITVCVPADQFSDKAALQGPSDFTSADEIVWHGSSFIVMTIDDYTGYGRGFIQATAVSMSQPDPPPQAIYTTQGHA